MYNYAPPPQTHERDFTFEQVVGMMFLVFAALVMIFWVGTKNKVRTRLIANLEASIQEGVPGVQINANHAVIRLRPLAGRVEILNASIRFPQARRWGRVDRIIIHGMDFRHLLMVWNKSFRLMGSGKWQVDLVGCHLNQESLGPVYSKPFVALGLPEIVASFGGEIVFDEQTDAYSLNGLYVVVDDLFGISMNAVLYRPAETAERKLAQLNLRFRNMTLLDRIARSTQLDSDREPTLEEYLTGTTKDRALLARQVASAQPKSYMQNISRELARFMRSPGSEIVISFQPTESVSLEDIRREGLPSALRRLNPSAQLTN